MKPSFLVSLYVALGFFPDDCYAGIHAGLDFFDDSVSSDMSVVFTADNLCGGGNHTPPEGVKAIEVPEKVQH